MSENILKRLDKIDKSAWSKQATTSLIVDWPGKYFPDAPYTYGRETSDKYLSLRELYLEIGDPTEYEFGNRVFGSMKRWLKIRDTAIGKKIFPSYANELAVKMKSEQLRGVVELASDPDVKENTKLAALKFLITSDWSPAKSTKADLRKRKKAVNNNVMDDMERLGLKVVK